jgi:hypothetical protein
MIQFNISIITSALTKVLSFLIIISLILPDCARCMNSDEIENISQSKNPPISVPFKEKNMNKGSTLSKHKEILHEVKDEIEETTSKDEIPLETFNRQIEPMLEDEEFNEHLTNLSNNQLVKLVTDHLDGISGKQVKKTYGKRKAAILFTLFAGAVISSIGSLTFLIGEHFPKEFATFANFSISDDVANGVGKYLGWSNMAVEALFYTWTIHGILPSLKPKQADNQPPEIEKQGFFRRCCSKFTSWLPSFGEWGLAIASAIPLTLLSLIDQEKEGIECFNYAVVGCIGLVTLVSNKFFLSLTHDQLKKVWTWLRARKKINNSHTESDVLEEAKKAFIESTRRSTERLKHLSKKDLGTEISSLRELAQIESDEESSTPDHRWKHLTNHMLKDLSFSPPKVNRKAVILVPALAVFTALSWLGLIATVPGGVEEKLNSSKALQYTLMVVAGIPLLEIGLSVGGSFGLKLSRIGNGARSLSANVTHWIERFVGYIPITLAGVGSFATTATLTIQQFKSVPAVCWILLPSATLGMDLINISTGCELWDAILVSIKSKFNPNKALFISHVDFLHDFQKKLERTPAEEVTAIVLKLDPAIQKNIMQYIPGMEEAEELQEWRTTLIRTLRKGMLN